MAHSNYKHGMTRIAGPKSPRTPTYTTWQRMKCRCQNPNDKDFAHYGGRGIRVCESWQSFMAFVSDMGLRPNGMQLDRIDNNGHYEPGNCRWVTKKQNARNRRSNVRLTVNGVTKTMVEWGEETGLGKLVENRIALGWEPERAVSEPRMAGRFQPKALAP